MAGKNHPTGYKLPVISEVKQGTVAQGFVTPKQDRVPQVQSIPPKRVLPIIFIPGIMGSNLRMSASRQAEMKASNNMAWRPDNIEFTGVQFNDTPVERQMRLDPRETEVDIYDPITNPTGNVKETADDRAKEVNGLMSYGLWGGGRLDGPLIQPDAPGTKNPKSMAQKARERGWGEIYIKSYNQILTTCESRLNGAFTNGNLDPYLKAQIVGIAPSKWQAHTSSTLSAVDEGMLRRTVTGCWFPVHAMGYNWLQGNMDSGIKTANRIRALIKRYEEQGYQCEKVILVTHSMGGLVARAVVHPEMGKLNDKVLGIIHGVMPAVGAGAAYKRVRCGFEGGNTLAKILGHIGSNVTPVLGNAQGGLELLPSCAYGKNWLQLKHRGKVLKGLPETGDPYEEIYKVRGKWYSLLREEWINPAHLDGPSFNHSCKLLDKAKAFHDAIATTYHEQSYAHYGADPNRRAWHNVVWEIDKGAMVNDVDMLTIAVDDSQGGLELSDPTYPSAPGGLVRKFRAVMLEPSDPGDQTVPLHSAEAQYSGPTI